MKIQVNTDNNVQGGEALSQMVENEVRSALAHYEDRLTRVEAFLGDENAAKGGADDKRCSLEARPEGLQPVAVTAHAGTLEQACKQAARKLHAALESTFGKLNDHN